MNPSKSLILVVGVFLGSTRLLLAAEEVVTFAQQSAKVGDRVAQTIHADLLVNSTITQAGQIANESQSKLKRRQSRFLEVLEVVEGSVRRAHVTYPLSRVISSESENPEQEEIQAVEKKSYLVTRQGERLLITDAEGMMPTQAEFEIVATGLKNLGLPNPLIKFLVGKTVRVGERLQLPREVAEQLMGLGDQFGKIKQFELVLKSVRTIDDQPCAVFTARIVTAGTSEKPMHIQMFGKIVIQTDTCRTVRAELSGPLTITTVEQTAAESFQFTAKGNMRLAVQSKYGHARQ